MYYSKTTGGFYTSSIHGENMPGDVVEISEEVHTALLAGESLGRRISTDKKGLPVLVDPPPLTPELAAAIEREWRAGQLMVTDGMVVRHRDELEEGTDTTLTSAQYAELQAYRRALRHWPEAGEFPLIEHRPSAPEWLSTLTQ